MAADRAGRGAEPDQWADPPPLSADETATLVEARIGGPVDDAVARAAVVRSADTGSRAFTLLVDLPGVLGIAGDATAQLRRAEALRHLPGAYSLAFRLREAGLPGELIAECLAMEREALEPLLNVAEAKLAAILIVERTDEMPSDEERLDRQRLLLFSAACTPTCQPAGGCALR